MGRKETADTAVLLVALSVHIFLIGLQQTGIWAQ